MTIKHGDIIQENCDIIACGIRPSMKLTSGAVCKALYKECGPSLQTSCDEKKGNLEKEGAVIIYCGGLHCRGIIFINNNKYKTKWHKGVMKILSLAEAKGYTSIALPAFGTACKGADVPELKSRILRGIEKFATEANPKSLRDVRLVIYDDSILNTFLDGWRDFRKDFQTQVLMSTRVQFVCQNDCNYPQSIQILKKTLKEDFSTFSFDKKKKIEALSNNVINELVDAGLRKRVQVTIEKERRSITLGSYDKEALEDLKGRVQGELDQFRVKEKKSGVRWQFLDKDKYVDYDEKTNVDIEEAYNKSDDWVDIETCRIIFKTMKEHQRDGLSPITNVRRECQ